MASLGERHPRYISKSSTGVPDTSCQPPSQQTTAYRDLAWMAAFAVMTLHLVRRQHGSVALELAPESNLPKGTHPVIRHHCTTDYQPWWSSMCLSETSNRVSDGLSGAIVDDKIFDFEWRLDQPSVLNERKASHNFLGDALEVLCRDCNGDLLIQGAIPFFVHSRIGRLVRYLRSLQGVGGNSPFSGFPSSLADEGSSPRSTFSTMLRDASSSGLRHNPTRLRKSSSSRP